MCYLRREVTWIRSSSFPRPEGVLASFVVSTGTERRAQSPLERWPGMITEFKVHWRVHRVQSPLERWPGMISTNRPKMESRPYEFLSIILDFWFFFSEDVGIMIKSSPFFLLFPTLEY